MRVAFVFFGLNKALQQARKADIIHTTTNASAPQARLVAKILKKKVVITIHEPYHKLRFHFLSWVSARAAYCRENLVCKLSYDHYIAPSLYTMNSIRLLYGKNDNKVSLIYHGIDYENWDKNRFTIEEIQTLRKQLGLQEKIVWLYFWRSGVGKGCIDLIYSVSHIIKQIPNFVCLMILAYTPEWPKTKIEQLVVELGIQKHIVLHDSVAYKELPKYVLSSNMTIVPSHAEWFGFAAAEVCGLDHPLVVSQIASLPEVVSGKVVFCQPNNPESIANAVVNMYQWHYILIDKKKFEWEQCIHTHLDLYKKLQWK